MKNLTLAVNVNSTNPLSPDTEKYVVNLVGGWALTMEKIPYTKTELHEGFLHVQNHGEAPHDNKMVERAIAQTVVRSVGVMAEEEPEIFDELLTADFSVEVDGSVRVSLLVEGGVMAVEETHKTANGVYEVIDEMAEAVNNQFKNIQALLGPLQEFESKFRGMDDALRYLFSQQPNAKYDDFLPLDVNTNQGEIQ